MTLTTLASRSRDTASEVIQSLNVVLRRHVYSSPFAARLLCGAKLEPFHAISFFELGTLATMRALATDLRPGLRMLDVGTGPYAIVAIWAARRAPMRVVATDIDAAVCESAARQVAKNGLLVDIRCADLLDGIDGRFDLIAFAGPAIRESVFLDGLRRQRISDPREAEMLRLRSCGGREGWETIDRLIAQAHARLAPGGSVYVCINRFHIDPERIRRSLAAHALACEREYRALFPFIVFVGVPSSPATLANGD